MPVQQGIGDDARSRAAFHVGHAATVEPAVLDGAAPGIVLPAAGIAGGEDVDMAVEHQVPSRARGVELRHEIRRFRQRGDQPVLEAACGEEAREMRGPGARVARWIGRRLAHELLQQADPFVGAGVDFRQQDFRQTAHAPPITPLQATE